jgi:protein-S-isoprenylcysteine O-methyltransferase Ste14
MSEQVENQPKTITPRVIVLTLIVVVVIPFLPLLISRQWDWWEAWIYAFISILGWAISRALAARRHPDLLAERARFLRHEDAKTWDKYLSPIVGFGSGLVLLVVGLDALYGWSPPFSLPVKLLALFAILAGYILGTLALMENRFFSGMVRIQTERGHRVVSSGLYGWIRHPGYAGALLTYLATPFFLDSRWALLPAVFITIVLIIRTRLEDKALQDELEGYRAYAERVRYCLLPGVW